MSRISQHLVSFWTPKRHPLVISCELLTGNPRLRITLNGQYQEPEPSDLKLQEALSFGGRLVKIETPHETKLELCLNIMEATPEDQHSHHVPPIEQLVIRPHIVPLLPTFHGMESENPYAHIKEFEDVCNTFQEGGASIDLMRLKLFPFTLKDKAKIWLNSLRPRTTPKTMCGGDFMSKNPEEAMDFLNYVAKVSRGWDEPNRREVGRMKSQPNALNAKPNNNASYGNTYNSNWRNHPNFSWKPRALQYTQPGQASQQASNLEQAIVNLSKVVGDFVGDQKSINAQLSQRIDSVENTLTNLNTVQEKGRFPSQPHQNPKGIHEVEAHEGESSQVRDVKAMITLRSGKEVELPTPKPHDETESEKEIEKRRKSKERRKSSGRKEDHDSIVNEDPEKIVINEDVMKKHMPPPFPQALHGKKGISNA
ncbi:hypothetical protein CK203_102214 [Vitis vinifera]|uniref:Retrotransposon gag domain-containing protein n=1 Tax=Vitis vinifera TaxID=29760 RepID=A0A438DFN4_VITVI|nr:hypothetical protein CK203_102214 [Vitis vinifera]